MFVFRPGVLERAPQSRIAITRAPDAPASRARLQRDLVDEFSNVSVIDAREVARTIESVLGNVTLAITVVGAVALLSGLLILAGAIAMTKFQRLHEAAVFKTLGASTRTMVLMLTIEYSTLGLLAGGVGAIGAVGLSWIVAQHVLEIRWRPAPDIALAGMVVTTMLVGGFGVLSSLDVLRRKPLSILRAE
jgi:putative ABC transport system permease protein